MRDTHRISVKCPNDVLFGVHELAKKRCDLSQSAVVVNLLKVVLRHMSDSELRQLSSDLPYNGRKYRIVVEFIDDDVKSVSC